MEKRRFALVVNNDGRERYVILEGEKRLALAVLEDAVSCFQKYATAKKGPGLRLFEDAQVYIDAEERNWSFSFICVCDLFGIDPFFLREGLAKWLAREQAGQNVRPAQKPVRHYIVRPRRKIIASESNRREKKRGALRAMRVAALLSSQQANDHHPPEEDDDEPKAIATK